MNELIVIAGIVLIAIAIIGGFTGQFNIPQLSRRQRSALGIFGIIVLIIGVLPSPIPPSIHPPTPTPTVTPSPTQIPTPTPTPSPSPSPIPPPSPSPTPTPTPIISIEAGWEYQTYVDSQGITAVHPDPEEDQLVPQAHLIDGHPNYSKGEIYLDLRSADVPDLQGKVPINMVGKEISALVKVPTDFVGDPSHPNGVQVFAKDSDWKSQYGPWKNIQRANTWITVTLSPTKEKIPMGYTDKGFDPTDIIMIGVKFGMGTGSNAKYDGPLYVKDIKLKLS